jgi:hypothetical protein
VSGSFVHIILPLLLLTAVTSVRTRLVIGSSAATSFFNFSSSRIVLSFGTNKSLLYKGFFGARASGAFLRCSFEPFLCVPFTKDYVRIAVTDFSVIDATPAIVFHNNPLALSELWRALQIQNLFHVIVFERRRETIFFGFR